jgi:antitoxin VapB
LARQERTVNALTVHPGVPDAKTNLALDRTVASGFGRIKANHGRRVDMSLNIKNTETHRLARELAALTGESVTEAVTVAVQERLDRVRHEGSGRLAERILAIGRDSAAHLREPYRSVDHAELLYDERGLPR